MKIKLKKIDGEVSEAACVFVHKDNTYVVGAGGIFGGDIKNYRKKINDDILRIKKTVTMSPSIPTAQQVTYEEETL